MRLYIVRHAIAVPRGTPWVEDDARELTEEGRSKMKQIALGLRALNYKPELILSSPLPRAAQTAEIVIEAFEKGIELKITPSLAPSGVRRELYREIRQYEKKLKSLMLVGHQPSLGEIAGEIAFGSPEQYIEFKKGGVCAIEWEIARGAPKGTMIALLTPSVLRSIAV
jgi:phosphohistidine phosphatase